MADYISDNVRLHTGVAGGGPAGMVQIAYATVTCGSAPTTSDTLQFFDLPAGSRVLASTIESTDMDTNGAPTITLNIGDAGSATRIFSASTVAQAGTAAVATATTGLGHKYTSKTRIVGVPQANATTGAAGTVGLWLMYVVE